MPKLLIIEEGNPQLQQRIHEIAKRTDWKEWDIQVATTREEVFSVLRSQPPEMLVVGPSSLELVNYIHRQDSLSTVITLAVLEERDDFEKILRQGAHDVIRLPRYRPESSLDERNALFEETLQQTLDMYRGVIDPQSKHIKAPLQSHVKGIAEIIVRYPDMLTLDDKKEVLNAVAKALDVEASITVKGAVTPRMRASS